MELKQAPDKNLAFELLRVTESAALAAARWLGKGAKEDGDGAALVELIVVLCWDNTTNNNYDILATELTELLDNLRNECKVTCSK